MMERGGIQRPLDIPKLKEIFKDNVEAQNRFRMAAENGAEAALESFEPFLGEFRAAEIQKIKDRVTPAKDDTKRLTALEGITLARTDDFITYLKSRPDVTPVLNRVQNLFQTEPMVSSRNLAGYIGNARAASDCIQGRLAAPGERTKAVEKTAAGVGSIRTRLQPILDTKIFDLIRNMETRADLNIAVLNNRMPERTDVEKDIKFNKPHDYTLQDLEAARALADFTKQQIVEQRMAVVQHVEQIVQEWFNETRVAQPKPSPAELTVLQKIYREVIAPLATEQISLSDTLQNEMKRYIFPEEYQEANH